MNGLSLLLIRSDYNFSFLGPTEVTQDARLARATKQSWPCYSDDLPVKTEEKYKLCEDLQIFTDIVEN